MQQASGNNGAAAATSGQAGPPAASGGLFELLSSPVQPAHNQTNTAAAAAAAAAAHANDRGYAPVPMLPSHSSMGSPVLDPYPGRGLSRLDLESFRYTYKPSRRSQAEGSLLAPLVDNLLLPPNSAINHTTHFHHTKGIISDAQPAAAAGYAASHGSVHSASGYNSFDLHAASAAAASTSYPSYSSDGGYSAGSASVLQYALPVGTDGCAVGDDAQNILKRRKRQRHPEKWKRNNYVRKVLKDKGSCNCTRQCFQLVSAEEREQIKKDFAAINKTAQDQQLLGLIAIEEKRGKAPEAKPAPAAAAAAPSTSVSKQPSTSITDLANVASALTGGGDLNALSKAADAKDDDEEDSDYDDDDEDGTKGDLGSKATHDSKRSAGSKRSPKLFNSKYYVRVGGNTPVPGSMAPPLPAGVVPVPSKLVRVCHYAFLSIHGIGKKRVNNLVSHAFANKDALAAAPRHDLRGRHSNRANRVAEDLVLLAEHHVKSFPRYGIIDGTDAWRQKRLQQRAKRDLARRRAEAAGTVLNPHPRIQSAKDSDVELPVEPMFGEAAAGIFSSGASVGNSSAKGSYPPLSVGMLLQRAPPRYLSPHLSLVKMYRLFIAHFQPLLLEVEKAAPRLTKIDRKGVPTTPRSATATVSTNTRPAASEELVSPPSALMPPPPAVRGRSGVSVVEETQPASSAAAAAESSPVPRASTGSVGSSSAGAVVVSAFSTISSSQLASVFEQMLCSQCSQQPAIIPVMWKQTSAATAAAAAKPAPAVPRAPSSLSKGSKRRRTGEPATPSGTETPATPLSALEDDNESIATSGAGGRKGSRVTVGAGGNASSLLGLFCSPACIQSFVTRFSCIVPQPLSSLVIPTPADANPAAANASRLVVPYASWRDMPNLAQADKLLKPLVSRDKYERLFRALNLRFGSGRNFDSCPTCNECALRMEAGEALSGLSRLTVQEAWNQHLIRAKKSADMVDFDRRMSIKSWQHFHAHHAAAQAAASSTMHAHFAMGTVDTIEVGFQANRPLPQYASSSSTNLLDSSAYKRQLWVYLYGIHHVASSQTHAFLWDEKTGKRKVNEVISCLWRHIQITAPPQHDAAIKAELSTPPARRAPWLIILGEGFRNYWSLCFLNELCRDDGSMQADGQGRPGIGGFDGSLHDSFTAGAGYPCSSSPSLFSYRRLDYKIMEGGHSCMESDKILACVERDSKSTPIFKPSDWVDAVRIIANNNTLRKSAPIPTAAAAAAGSSGPKPRVSPFWQSRQHIFDWKRWLSQSYSKSLSLRTTDHQPVDLNKAVWFNFGVGKDTSPSATHSDLPNLVYHPDEVWLRYSLNDQEPWKKVRLRKYPTIDGMPSAFSPEGQPYPTLPDSTQPLQRMYPLDDAPLPIPYRKQRDLYELRRFVPPQYHSFYPPPATAQTPAEKQSEVQNDTEYDEEVDDDDLFLAPTVPIEVPLLTVQNQAASVSAQMALAQPVHSANTFQNPAHLMSSQAQAYQAFSHQQQLSAQAHHQQQQQQAAQHRAMASQGYGHFNPNGPMGPPAMPPPFYYPPKQSQPSPPPLPQPMQMQPANLFTQQPPQQPPMMQPPQPQPPQLAPPLTLQSLGVVAANFTNQIGLAPPPPTTAMQPQVQQLQQPQQPPPALPFAPQAPSLSLPVPPLGGGGVGSISVFVNGIGHMDLHTLQTLSRMQMFGANGGANMGTAQQTNSQPPPMQPPSFNPSLGQMSSLQLQQQQMQQAHYQQQQQQQQLEQLQRQIQQQQQTMAQQQMQYQQQQMQNQQAQQHLQHQLQAPRPSSMLSAFSASTPSHDSSTDHMDDPIAHHHSGVGVGGVGSALGGNLHLSHNAPASYNPMQLSQHDPFNAANAVSHAAATGASGRGGYSNYMSSPPAPKLQSPPLHSLPLSSHSHGAPSSFSLHSPMHHAPDPRHLHSPPLTPTLQPEAGMLNMEHNDEPY